MRRDIANKLVNGPVWLRNLQHVGRTLAAMEREGHIGRTRPARGPGKNMIGLTAAGAAHYGLSVDPGNLVGETPPPLRPKSNHAMHRDMIAEHVAEGGSIVSAAPLVGMSKAYCQLRWSEIVAALGPQAI